MTALELAGKIVSCIDAKKGEDIKLLDVHDRTTLCDYFVIASGSSTPQLRAMADEIDEKLSELGIDARRGRAGKQLTGCCWIMKRSSFICSGEKSVNSIRWSDYGEMPRKWIFQTWLSPTEGFGQTGREE